MFERFTDRARKVVALADDQARDFNHNYIGTEHILLGLLTEGEGVGFKILDQYGITKAAVAEQVLDIIGEGQQAPAGHIPFTPRAKKILELALREALQLGHSYIGTEHILLGLVREGEGVGAQVLTRVGLGDLGLLRTGVLEFLRAEGNLDEPEEGELLTPKEREVLELCRQLGTAVAAAIPAGPNFAHDWNELAASIHHIQHAFMAQACARRYPAEFRLLGKGL